MVPVSARPAVDLTVASGRASEWGRPTATWVPASGLRMVRPGSVLRIPMRSRATRHPMRKDKLVVVWEAVTWEVVTWEVVVGVDAVVADRLVANARNRLSPANNSHRTT